MKVLLNGATSGTNFGDFIFAKMFQDKVVRLIGKENVYWYKSSFALSDFFSSRLDYDRKRKFYLCDIDALILISGGYFYGDDHSCKDYILRYLRYFHIVFRCLIHKIPFAIIAVEVGPTKSLILSFIEKFILRRAKLLIVRNPESEKFVKQLGIDNVICTVDSVFAMERNLFENMSIPKEIELCSRPKLFFHINPSDNRNKDIREKVIPIINEFCVRHPDFVVIVGSDQYAINQRNAFDVVRQLLSVDEVYFCEYDNPIALCKVLDNCDLIVTHKLHVGIVGAYLSKSVVSFSSHTGKIERLYRQLNIIERTTPLSTLSLEKGISMLEQFYDKKIIVPDLIKNMSVQNFEYLESFIKKLE